MGSSAEDASFAVMQPPAAALQEAPDEALLDSLQMSLEECSLDERESSADERQGTLEDDLLCDLLGSSVHEASSHTPLGAGGGAPDEGALVSASGGSSSSSFQDKGNAVWHSAPVGPADITKVWAPRELIGHGLVYWPLEVRLCIATFLKWAELARDAVLCRAWRQMAEQDTLWKSYYQLTWPRLARREEVNAVKHRAGWRARFQEKWKEADRAEDALEEDWLDLAAAQDLRPKPPRGQGDLTEQEKVDRRVRQALQRCRELLQCSGVSVPADPGAGHICHKQCVHHRLFHGLDAFLCQTSGALHRCSLEVPCPGCLSSGDDCFLVCPVSGRCYAKVIDASEERQADESAQACERKGGQHDWDPGSSMAQQFGVWFEQGYSMSEEQAKDFFKDDRQGLLGGAC